MLGAKIKKIECVILLSVICIASFWKILTFGFWIDDWGLLWGSLYNPSSLLRFFDHPGSPLMFYTLSHIFGLNSVPWYIFLLCIKVLTAYLVGLFLYKFTNSKIAGVIGAIFFTASYAGYQAIDAPSSSTAALVGVFLVLSLIYFIDAFTKHKKYFLVSFLFIALSFFLDPGRAIPMVFIVPFLLLFFPRTKEIIVIQKLLAKIFLIAIVIGAPLFIFWFTHFKHDSQIGRLFQHPIYFITKIDRIRNLFASIGNLFIGLIYPVKENEIDVSVYSPIFGVSGIILLFIGIGTFINFLRKKSKTIGIISFFIFWVFIFYLPNFLSEPRAPMAGPNRYLYLSSIGFIYLIAYLLSKLHKRLVVIGLSGLFVLLNIYRANSILSWQSSYRQASVINNMWSTIDRDVPKNEVNDIFIFTGQQPWLQQNLDFSVYYPFLIKRKFHANYSEFPIVTRDEKTILTYLCSNGKIQIGSKFYQKTQIPITHLYAWQVKSPGVLVNISAEERKYFSEKAKEKVCAFTSTKF